MPIGPITVEPRIAAKTPATLSVAPRDPSVAVDYPIFAVRSGIIGSACMYEGRLPATSAELESYFKRVTIRSLDGDYNLVSSRITSFRPTDRHPNGPRPACLDGACPPARRGARSAALVPGRSQGSLIRAIGRDAGRTAGGGPYCQRVLLKSRIVQHQGSTSTARDPAAARGRARSMGDCPVVDADGEVLAAHLLQLGPPRHQGEVLAALDDGDALSGEA